MDRVNVNHEWGTLREAVVGIPFFKIPTSLPKAVYSYAPEEGIAFFEANLGKTLDEADPEIHARVSEQMDAVIEILESREAPRPTHRQRNRGRDRPDRLT